MTEAWPQHASQLYEHVSLAENLNYQERNMLRDILGEGSTRYVSAEERGTVRYQEILDTMLRQAHEQE